MERPNRMNTLTIYSGRYDLNENMVNGGMSGKAFLDMDNKMGTPFNSMDSALDYLMENNIPIHRIEFNYVDKDGVQMFSKFDVAVQ